MIRSVTIRRFKMFDEATFDIAGHVVLAGQNNSGKTTVLQALAAWSLALEQWKLLNDDHKHKGAYSKKPLARQAFNAVPLRAFDMLWKDRAYEGEVTVEVTMATGATVAMELAADSSEQIYVRPTKETSREALARAMPSMVYVSSVDGLEIEEPWINNPDWIRTLLGRQRPGSILRNLLVMAAATAAWDDLRGSVARLFGVELLAPQTLGGQIVCEFRRPGEKRSLDILNAGSGLHQVLLLLACLHTRPGAVLLIDEPDAHLHVFLQDTIFSEIRQVAAKTNAQVILATHSEVIFRSVPPEQLVVMMGNPRRLTDVTEREQLSRAMAVLEQVDILNSLRAPGVLYFENYTDLNLLRAWAQVLGHRTADYLNQQPFWKPQVWEPRDDARGIKAQEHFNALKLVRADIGGVWLVDGDGKRNIKVGEAPEPSKLNRVAWSRYETESYLVHPAALARFINARTDAGGGVDAVRSFFSQAFDEFLGAGIGSRVADEFIANPRTPSGAVERYLQETKARTTILGGILEEAGIHGFDYTRFSEIAIMMEPDEIHPEVVEKLDFIQKAFGL